MKSGPIVDLKKTSSVYRIQTRKKHLDGTMWNTVVLVDVDFLMKVMARKAIYCSGNKSVDVSGAITATANIIGA